MDIDLAWLPVHNYVEDAKLIAEVAAALSRQHPRDLFDVGLLLQDERANEMLWRTFLVY